MRTGTYSSLSAIAVAITGTRWNGLAFFGLTRPAGRRAEGAAPCEKVIRMGRLPKPSPARLRCAIYTRKSTEEGLDQEFNSLDAQREAAEAFIQSQRREGWIALPELYDDGGFTGANMDRPALTKLLQAVEAGELDCVVVYKVDRSEPIAAGLHPHAERVREAQGEFRGGHPAVQHQHIARDG